MISNNISINGRLPEKAHRYNDRLQKDDCTMHITADGPRLVIHGWKIANGANNYYRPNCTSIHVDGK